MMKRIRMPLLWNERIFNMTSYGKIQKKDLEIIHKYTENVRNPVKTF
jgi:hypothetical protein